MRIHALSDVHVDHEENENWVGALSTSDFVDDVLVLAGDVSDSLDKLERGLEQLSRRFRKVLFVPGNHDLWVARDRPDWSSLDKFEAVRAVVRRSGASMDVHRSVAVTIVPMLAWYDYSFGLPDEQLRRVWADFRMCRWPDHASEREVADHFLALNTYRPAAGEFVVSFSHFLPRIDVMPHYIPPEMQRLYPVLGTQRLDSQVRALGSAIHVYGHSHVNRQVRLDGTLYVNNAFGYPHETRITGKTLRVIREFA